MKSLLAFLTLGVFSFHLAAQLSFNVSATLTGVTAPHCVAVADLTGDGMLDLICANGSGANLTIFSNQGNGQFNLTATPPVGNGPPSVIAVDVNGDG